MSESIIPVVLFAYARPAHLTRVLTCLRENKVPLIYVYSDAAKGPKDANAVSEVRALLHAIDWADIQLVERTENLGLARSVLAGVSAVAACHEALIVWEDDLICVRGTYTWLCSALNHYATNNLVMSVSAWTHPRVIPSDVDTEPYFDARAECWGWGTWARAWEGMQGEDARAKMAAAAQRGIPADSYGADLPAMAHEEERKNIWAVRWLYHHLQHRGLCLRPPWSMVEHIGCDATATNSADAAEWANPPLRIVPPVPNIWPKPSEHPQCSTLWCAATPSRLRRLWRRLWQSKLYSQC